LIPKSRAINEEYKELDQRTQTALEEAKKTQRKSERMLGKSEKMLAMAKKIIASFEEQQP